MAKNQMVLVTPEGTSIPIQKKSVLKKMWNHRMYYFFLLPAVVFLLIFSYRPYIWITMAFQDFDFMSGLFGSEFVGFKHFVDFLTLPDFYRILRNTIVINFSSFFFGFPAPIILALFINELRSRRFKRITQTITYLPHFVSWVIVAGLFYNLLNEDVGIFNVIRSAFGMEKIAYLREAKYFWPIIVLVAIWKEIGWSSIIYLASMSSIDQEQYDAATVDGASRFQKMIYITLPGIYPTISVMLILAAGTIITGGGIVPDFDAIYNMRNPMVNETAEIIQIHTYSQGVMYSRYSYATAIGITQSAVACILVFISNYLAKKFRGYSVF